LYSARTKRTFDKIVFYFNGTPNSSNNCSEQKPRIYFLSGNNPNSALDKRDWPSSSNFVWYSLLVKLGWHKEKIILMINISHLSKSDFSF